jgi:hypothetical protein
MKFEFKKMEPKDGLLFIFILVLILAVSVFFIYRKNVNANYDYICTQTIPVSGACVIPADSWSNWQIVTPSTVSTPGKTKRTGTGSKEVSLVKSYVASTRGACGAGTVQTVRGTAVNSATWWGGEINVASASCQIDEFGVIPASGRRGPSGNCIDPLVMLADGTCGDAIVDLCPNIPGTQATLNNGLAIDPKTGNCGFVDSGDDQCMNLSGFQSLIPTGMLQDSTTTRMCTSADATLTTTFQDLTSSCSAIQGSSDSVYINKEMIWNVVIPASLPGLKITDTVWTGTDIPPAGITTIGTNSLHKIYTTVGLKQISGVVSASNSDLSKIYNIKCENGSTTVKLGGGIQGEI